MCAQIAPTLKVCARKNRKKVTQIRALTSVFHFRNITFGF